MHQKRISRPEPLCACCFDGEAYSERDLRIRNCLDVGKCSGGLAGMDLEPRTWLYRCWGSVVEYMESVLGYVESIVGYMLKPIYSFQ